MNLLAKLLDDLLQRQTMQQDRNEVSFRRFGLRLRLSWTRSTRNEAYQSDWPECS